jgi:hypothetical protein
MSKGHDVLEALADRMERSGEDSARVDIVRRAQRFKRSWVELAEGLHALRKTRRYEEWGFSDLSDYCTKELHIKAATLDKLVLSYGALREHAPDVLARDGVSRDIPSLDAVDYFSKALGDRDRNDGDKKRLDAPSGVIDELRAAVFDEGRSVGELRKRFDPILRPRSPDEEQSDGLRRLKALADRMNEAVQNTAGLSEKRVARVVAALEALLRDIAEMVQQEAKPQATSSAARRAEAPRARA